MKQIAVILGCTERGTLPASDRAAIAMALRIGCGEVRAYSLRSDEVALRYALAAGVVTAKPLDDLNDLPFDLALIGAGGCEPWGDLLPAMLAQKCSCGLVVDVVKIEPASDEMRVTRDLGRGAREVLRVRGPAVLAISEEADQTLYVSRHRRKMAALSQKLAAGRPWLDPLENVAGSWEPARPRVKTGNLAAKTGGAATDRMNALMGATQSTEDRQDRQVIRGDAATCARQLLRYLRHHGFLPPGAGVRTEDLPQETGLCPQEATPDLSRRVAGADASTLWQENSACRSHRLLRSPRSLSGATSGVQRRPQPLAFPSAVLSGNLLRSPRPLNGSGHIPPMVRRPRPVTIQPAFMPAGKLSRRPRPIGLNSPRPIRGPYPIQGPPHHG